MSKEYIELEAAISAIVDNIGDINIRTAIAAGCIIGRIPAADAVEVRHGRWRITEDGAAYCLACKRKMNPYLHGYAYCAMCGAKMDGGVNDAAD